MLSRESSVKSHVERYSGARGHGQSPQPESIIAEKKDFCGCPEAHSSCTEKALGRVESEAEE